MPEAAIIVGGLLLDLISKSIIEHTMELGQSVTVIPKLLNFSYTINKRAAFSFDFGLSNVLGEKGVIIFFIIVTVIAVGFFGYLLFKAPKKGMLFRISFALIIAGALGNMFDRIFCEGVRDFIQIEYLGLELFGSNTFAIFNIADSCVVVGAILLVVFYIFFDETLRGSKGSEVKEDAIAQEGAESEQSGEEQEQSVIIENQEDDNSAEAEKTEK